MIAQYSWLRMRIWSQGSFRQMQKISCFKGGIQLRVSHFMYVSPRNIRTSTHQQAVDKLFLIFGTCNCLLLFVCAIFIDAVLHTRRSKLNILSFAEHVKRSVQAWMENVMITDYRIYPQKRLKRIRSCLLRKHKKSGIRMKNI